MEVNLDGSMETPNERSIRIELITEVEDVCNQGDSDGSCTSTQFLETQKNQLFALQALERYCNVRPVLGLNSAKCDINS